MTDFTPFEPGTVQVTSGGKTITGTGTDFTVYSPGDTIWVDGYPMLLDTIASATSAQAKFNHLGSSGSGKTYRWVPLSDLSRAIALDTRLSSYFGSGNLSAEANLTGAADTISYYTGVGTKATTGFTAAARSVLDDTSVGAMRTTMGVGTGDSPQFAGLNVGNASDTTVTRGAAGEINVEGSRVFQRSNILGTTSQSGGVPTGAIVERGSNANGEYVRYADGTQICWLFSTTITPTASLTGYEVSATFPAAFSAVPGIALTAQGNTSQTDGRPTNWDVAIRSPGTTSVSLDAYYTQRLGGANSPSVTLHAIAIGRWF